MPRGQFGLLRRAQSNVCPHRRSRTNKPPSSLECKVVSLPSALPTCVLLSSSLAVFRVSAKRATSGLLRATKRTVQHRRLVQVECSTRQMNRQVCKSLHRKGPFPSHLSLHVDLGLVMRNPRMERMACFPFVSSSRLYENSTSATSSGDLQSWFAL